MFLQDYLEDKMRQKILNKIKNTDQDSRPYWQAAALYLPERIPILGNFVKNISVKRTSFTVPLVDTFMSIFKEIKKGIDSEDKVSAKKAYSKSLEAFLILFTGKPGIKQTQDFYEGKLNKKTKSNRDINRFDEDYKEVSKDRNPNRFDEDYKKSKKTRNIDRFDD